MEVGINVGTMPKNGGSSPSIPAKSAKQRNHSVNGKIPTVREGTTDFLICLSTKMLKRLRECQSAIIIGAKTESVGISCKSFTKAVLGLLTPVIKGDE